MSSIIPHSQIHPHVIIFPFPIQGHINSMLKLSELLCQSGITVTFLNSDHNHLRIISCSDIESYFLAKYPDRFNFATISDGLSDDHPRSGTKIGELFEAVEVTIVPLFREMLISGGLNSGLGWKPNCIIVDGIMCSGIKVGNEMGIPVIAFRTISASCFWAFYCIPNLIKSGEIPFQENVDDMDKYAKSVAGMENILRLRDLPGFCRASNIHSNKGLQMMMNQTQLTKTAHGLILNTTEELEEEALNQIRFHIPNVYTIGPLHARLTPSTRPSTSLWHEDRRCMSWLDTQPRRSVIYVSFGSVAVMKSEHVVEIWHGLKNSGIPFLWVFRPNSVVGDWSEIIDDVRVHHEKTRWFMVEWAPQEEVLGHGSVGGFLTHCGWNSTLESMVLGVPMICWPYFGDQQVNSRFVGEVWKTGLDMKDLCDRKVVERMVKELLDLRKDEFWESGRGMAKLLDEALGLGGSSSRHLERLIEDIKVML